LILYKLFHHVGSNIGLSTESIFWNWRNWRYHAWNVDQCPFPNELDEEHVEPLIGDENVDQDFEEWQLFSRLVPPSCVNILDLDNVGRRDFNVDYNWQEMMVSNEFLEEGVNFLKYA